MVVAVLADDQWPPTSALEASSFFVTPPDFKHDNRHLNNGGRKKYTDIADQSIGKAKETNA